MRLTLANMVLVGVFGAGIAVLANSVTLPPLVILALIMVAIAIPTTLALRADSKRRGIPTRF